jgi:3-oxoacyl-[acyl-carrier-protein] synthase-3
MRISGWGATLPDKTVTNTDLEGWLDTDDAWIRERTGISERHIGSSTTELAIDAGRQAIERAGLADDQIDLVIVATVSPDKATPATASFVQDALGLSCGAFDLNAACSGFVYGLVAANGFLASGMRHVLLIGAETMSRLVDWDDRGTAILFGDGGGAVVLSATEEPSTLLGWDLGSDGAAAGILHADIGGFLHMDGGKVFKRAVLAMAESSSQAMARAGVVADDIALLIPHQANRRIIEASSERLGIPLERVAMVLEHTGNTSAASIPLALAETLDAGRLHDGDLVLLSGFGAGMTWASAVLRWNA